MIGGIFCDGLEGSINIFGGCILLKLEIKIGLIGYVLDNSYLFK